MGDTRVDRRHCTGMRCHGEDEESCDQAVRERVSHRGCPFRAGVHGMALFACTTMPQTSRRDEMHTFLVTSLLQLPSDRLSVDDIDALRGLFEAVWGDDDWTNEDWEHAFCGRHFILKQDADVLAHASVVERELHASGFNFVPATWRPSRHPRLIGDSATARR
jgi:hypothetical protein